MARDPHYGVVSDQTQGFGRMAEIILVRHGQANSHATDEASYDRLSELGQQQARWLGAHLGQTNAQFDHVVSGTLSRQVETARAMGFEPHEQDARLNELRYFELARALETQFDVAPPQGPADFAAHLPQLMAHWAEGRLADVPESFEHFSGRMREVIDELCARGGRSLVVTSGGVIGVLVQSILTLGTTAMSGIMLQTMNSSVHRLHYVHDRLMLGTFNATPHLDTPERASAKTFV